MLHQGQASPGSLVYTPPLPQAVQNVILRQVAVQLCQRVKAACLLHRAAGTF